MPTFVEVPSVSPASAARSRRLAWSGYAALVAWTVVYWFRSPWESATLNVLAVTICALGFVPMLRWLQRNEPAYPLMEVMQLTMVPFYAVPLITEHTAILHYSESILIQASWTVVIFQIACLLGAQLARRRYLSPKEAWWDRAWVSDQNLRFTGYTLILPTIWLFMQSFMPIFPPELTGTLRAIFFGIAIISGFVQARLWGSDQLSQSSKVIFVINIVLQVILNNLGLLLITSLSMLLIIFVGYFSSARRIPWVVCLSAFAMFAVLHSGKHKMRELHWGEDTQAVKLSEVPDFYKEWFNYGMESMLVRGETDPVKKNSSIFERASLLHMVCYTVDTVPDRSPYLEGSTYSYVLPQIFPRFIWPNKPSPNDSVKTLSIRLGLLDQDQAQTTSVAFGLIAEAYANFGIYAIVVLAFVLGWCLCSASRGTAHSATFSVGGIFRILCLAWCLNAETTLAVWLSSFYQACIAILAPLFLYRTLFGD